MVFVYQYSQMHFQIDSSTFIIMKIIFIEIFTLDKLIIKIEEEAVVKNIGMRWKLFFNFISFLEQTWK